MSLSDKIFYNIRSDSGVKLNPRLKTEDVKEAVKLLKEKLHFEIWSIDCGCCSRTAISQETLEHTIAEIFGKELI